MSNLAVFTDQNFEAEVLNSPVPVLVDFSATWCGPCKALHPIVEELAKDYAGKIKCGKLDIDHSRGVPTKYGIMAVPTIIFFKGGREMEKITGLKPKGELRKSIDKVLTA